jgi:hypothetical protein
MPRLVLTNANRRRQQDDDAADPRAVEELVRDWSSAILACRAGNHQWMPSTVDDARTFWIIRERCPRCKTEREWDMDPKSGEQYGDKRIDYSKTDGYLAKGVGRMGAQGRNMIRKEAVLRNMPKPRKLTQAQLGTIYVHKGTAEALSEAS